MAKRAKRRLSDQNSIPGETGVSQTAAKPAKPRKPGSGGDISSTQSGADKRTHRAKNGKCGARVSALLAREPMSCLPERTRRALTIGASMGASAR